MVRAGAPLRATGACTQGYGRWIVVARQLWMVQAWEIRRWMRVLLESSVIFQAPVRFPLRSLLTARIGRWLVVSGRASDKTFDGKFAWSWSYAGVQIEGSYCRRLEEAIIQAYRIHNSTDFSDGLNVQTCHRMLTYPSSDRDPVWNQRLALIIPDILVYARPKLTFNDGNETTAQCCTTNMRGAADPRLGPPIGNPPTGYPPTGIPPTES